MQIVLLCILLSALSGRVYAQETQIETYVEELNLQSVQQSVDEMTRIAKEVWHEIKENY